jgi:lysyl-tRNA synthetase class 2
MDTFDELVAARHHNLDALRAVGVAPYGGAFPKGQPIAQVVQGYQEGQAVSTAGRLIAKRGHGGMTFADLRDDSGKIQLCFKHDVLGPAYDPLSHVDLGDWIGVAGALFKTRTGEATVKVERWTMLAKSLRPLPEKWHGLRDLETRYRRRYLDLATNEPVRRVFQQRARLVDSLRRTLNGYGYLEVETPMMHALAGGAAGEPFTTTHNALSLELHLRLAPELYLKRLLVGGFEKVYELNRCFRNEGISTRHNPEFTMLEAYCAYENSTYMMRLVRELIIEAAKATIGTLQWTYQGRAIDLSKEWEVISFTDRLREGYDLRPEDGLDAMQQKLRHPKPGFKAIDMKGQSRSQLLRVIEELVEPEAKETPVFVTDYWAATSPLAKSRPDNPLVVERFELYLGGFEVANAYSELNDPIEQRRRFQSQLEEQPANATRAIDEDFVEALEYGMPPATGLGVGIDRLAMVLLDQPSIKDVILFPLLKPETSSPEPEGTSI